MSGKNKFKRNIGCGTIVFIILFVFAVLGVIGYFIESEPLKTIAILCIFFAIGILVGVNNSQKKKAIKIVDKIRFYFNCSENAATITDFIANWSLMSQENSNLFSLEKKLLSGKLKSSVQNTLASIPSTNSEQYQWYLRNAIDRQKENVINAIKKTYRNSQLYKQLEYDNFCADIRNSSSLYNSETLDFANFAIDEVSHTLGGVSGRRMPEQKDYASYQRSLLTPSLRYDIMKRDGFRCTICGRGQEDGVKLHVDHIKPVSKGGETTPNNLRTLCQDCNLGKSDKYSEDQDN